MTENQEQAVGTPEVYLPFVRKIARRMARRLPRSVDLDDLVSAGTVGLMEAMDRYDPDGGRGFESYAEFRVKGAMLDELRKADPLNRASRNLRNRIQNTSEQLWAEFGREPEPEEMATAMGTTLEHYLNRMASARALRVVAMDTDGVLPDDPQPLVPNQEELLARQEVVEQVHAAMEKLPERQQLVLSLYYVEELTQAQIGEVLGVSESRVCQILSEVVSRLQRHVRAGKGE